MARGFESKAVADQQESAQERRRPRAPPEVVVDAKRVARVRQLQLARADVERRLEEAASPAHRQTLERALRALLEDLRALE
jgi:hypothetical protein